MKCDELKDRWFTAYPVEGDQLIEVEVYGRKEVDETIAELIDANEKGQNITQQCFKREVEFRKRIDELNNKNQNSNRELRATKRALWLVRAERAHVTTLLWNVYCYQNNCLYFRDFMNVKCNPFRNLPKKTAMEWSDLWESIETKCLAKAKEYK